MMWRLGLLVLAQAVNRDLQAAARRAGGAKALWDCDQGRLPSVLGHDDDALRAWKAARKAFSTEWAMEELARQGAWWSAQLPPSIDALGDGVSGWAVGDEGGALLAEQALELSLIHI